MKLYSRLLALVVVCLLGLGVQSTKAACSSIFQFSTAQCPTVQFYDGSSSTSGNITQWNWTFGDGTSSTLQNPTHTYTANGMYQACLTITTSQGCTANYCANVGITCIPANGCNASYTVGSGNCPAFSFTSTATTTSGTITGWSWTFGDGGTGTGSTVTHTYAANGTYSVCLTVTSSTGCTNTFCNLVNVTCIVPPTCTATYTMQQGTGCGNYYFSSGSTTNTGTITGYSWTFGDGSTGTGPQVNHVYTANGSYNVCLTITTSTGCTNSYCSTVNVTCIQPPTCAANFTISGANCPAYGFNSTSTTSSGTITGYSWNFGDGSTGTGPNVTHTYAANGTYNVCLTITASTGCTNTFCSTVNVTCVPPPTCAANYTFTQGTGCGNYYFSSTSTTSSGTITGYSWNFGDGTTGTGGQVGHTFTTNGTYQVCLTITASTGCTNTYCSAVTVTCYQPTCAANFTTQSGTGCGVYYFSSTSTTSSGTITGYSWNYGDGSTGTGAQSTHTYTANGTYQVCLTITASTGCTNTFCSTVNVTCIQPTCAATFTISGANCPAYAFAGIGSTNSGTVTGYSWNFGDGSTGTGQNVTHTFAANGTYNVCLTITTSTGCTNTYCSNVNVTCIQPTCAANFTFTQSNVCGQYYFSSTSTTSSGTITGYSWNFGDGTTGTGGQVGHTFTANGSYNVCLTITASTGCTNTYCATVNVTCIVPPCHAAFTVNTSGCPQILFTNTSNNLSTGVTFNWTFGDGGTSTATNPAHTYLTNGSYVVCLTMHTPDNCTSTFCDTIAINCNVTPVCAANFTVIPGTNCPLFYFSSTSTTNTGTITGYSWNFGDGTTGTGAQVSHSYTANGAYSVCLTITTSTGCTNTICEPVNVTCIQPPTCAASFTVSNGNCPAFGFVSTSTTSSGSITGWTWSFGDGSSGTGANVTHTYAANGTYNVCLTITSSNGCTNTSCSTVNVTCVPTCAAGFNVIPGTNCPLFYFSSTSTTSSGTITGYSWNFGDGTSGTGAQTSHAFTANGTYNVCLTITASTGCTSTICHTVTVTCIQPPTCTAAFNTIQANCPQFYFSSTSTTSSGTITGYSWNFGDGTSGTGAQVGHSYTANGTYNVCLTITTSNGCTSTVCHTVTVTCIQPPTCTANFNILTAPCPLYYFSSTSTTNSGTITGWSWNFGDGTTGTGAQVSHTFTQNGTFQVCLTITTSTGCTNTFCRTVTVTCIQPPTCRANFNMTAASCRLFYFSSTSTTSSGTITGYSWTFGDGSTGTGPQISHSYNANGVYQVCLTITTSTGCTNTFCRAVTVNCIQPPVCNANFNILPANCPLFYFVSTSTTNTGTITSYSWNYGDGTSGTGAQASHTYTANGTYYVCLTITTSAGCTNTYCRTVTVNCLPATCNAEFTFQSTPNHAVYFVNQSTANPGPISSYNWNFGDGGTSTQQNPMHVFTQAGNYHVCLTISTANTTGVPCVDSTCHTVVITPVARPAEPVLRLQSVPNPFGDQMRVEYTLSDPADVELTLFDHQGHAVALLDKGERTEGEHVVPFDATGLSKGMYLLRIRSGEQSKSLTVVRQ